MTQATLFDLELTWGLMTPMEQALYGTTFALHGMNVEAGLAAADAVVAKLRAISGQRSRLPEPEYEAARAGLNIEYEEFAVWYPVQYLIRHGRERGYKPPTPEETQEAYRRYGLGCSDFC
jgi:hypothetical protein